jgi:hypothetical protein
MQRRQQQTGGWRLKEIIATYGALYAVHIERLEDS